MFLKDLQLIQFKNYVGGNFEFSRGINVISGKNGVGKTNLLDAIHYLSMCKSYYTASDQQNIHYNDDFFALHGHFEEEGVSGYTKVSCMQKRGYKKIFKINQKTYERLSEHIGKFPSVMISPYDQDYIQGGSESRRKYFDSVISQYDHEYLNALIQYNKVLFQRNLLLRQFFRNSSYNKDSIEVWNDRLIFFGNAVHEVRKKFIKEYIPVFISYFKRMSNENEEVDIIYDSKLLESSFEDLLKDSEQKDYYANYTNCGIHKDDFLFMMNGHQIKKFGSQGQQKTFLIALKLAQFEYIKGIKHQAPMLLLDDIFDKLDKQRVQCLTQMVANDEFGQVFLTDTQTDRLEGLCNEINVNPNTIHLT